MKLQITVVNGGGPLKTVINKISQSAFHFKISKTISKIFLAQILTLPVLERGGGGAVKSIPPLLVPTQHLRGW